jgi:hypothetical protein
MSTICQIGLFALWTLFVFASAYEGGFNDGQRCRRRRD